MNTGDARTVLITLEYTSNVLNAADWGDLLRRIRNIAGRATRIDPSRCKGRILEHVTHRPDQHNRGQVHLGVALPDGVSGILKRELGDTLRNLLLTLLLPENQSIDLQIRVELSDEKGSESFNYPKNAMREIPGAID